jgi:cytosine deaminase
MITVNPAKIMRIEAYGLSVGNPANLVILNAQDLREALAYHSEPLYVITNGTLRCETRLNRTRHSKST